MIDLSQVELEILTGCLESRKNTGLALEKLDGYKFSSKPFHWVWTTIREAYRKSSEVPTVPILAFRADREIKDDDLFEEIVGSLKKIKGCQTDSPFPLLLDEAVQTHNKSKLIETAGKVLDSVERGDLDEAQKDLASGMVSLNRRNQRTGAGGLVEIVREALASKDTQTDFIPTGFSWLDRRIRGASKGQVWLLCGITGIGKSVAMIQVGQAAIGAKARVLHITTEMTRQEISWRYLSRFTGIPEQHLRESRMSTREKQLMRAWMDRNESRLNDLLRIEQITPHVGTVNEVRAAIDELKRDGTPPDVLIIDSPDHIRSPQRHSKKIEESSDVWWSVKAMATEGYITWTTSQIQRDWEMKIATPRAVADNIDKPRIATAFMSLNWVIDSGKITGQRQLYLGKFRSGLDKVLMPLQCDISRMVMVTTPEKSLSEDESP